MGKLKTVKAVAKRVKITKNKKILKKTAGQDHFNSREPGKVTRQKRNQNTVAKATAQNIKNFIPYN
ncbi:50S ribosomal protein L35 [Candidatus Falkowbacteria bacterium CG10_big_fil_rev_8_21_14_0_10_39_11]|uniref:Large ribosomal subunit protein bL35 n=1 Tax=Candidatus Falkowbacteria bacterium CG10_big_fil_rev_8_21_14_0_10_39_11 TaxID=1974565 RepID=A0A2H0V5U3_9BACT|nr:MAG: 50S ribosomal protein L35 [Candidatus Falkowbacteria bacterium CG10_big_fil_rev_8_21_14_0_10_39_11]